MLAYLEQPPRVARKTTIDGITPRSGLPRPKAPAPCIASVGDGGAVRTSDGVSIGDVHGPEVLEDADLLVFPSWSTGLPLPSPSLVQHIRDAHDRGAALAGLCLGAFALAHSGVLDGRAAVTHWARADVLQDRDGDQQEPRCASSLTLAQHGPPESTDPDFTSVDTR
jgi:transcriptional regulator GlxA family with amidase domain